MAIPSFGILPMAVHGLSAAKVLPKAHWVVVRTAQYEEANWTCQWCSRVMDEPTPARGFECHEDWHFDTKTGVASVVGLFALCKMCHLTQHLAYASIQGIVDKVVAHYATTNSLSRATAKKHRLDASARFKELNALPWVTDLSWVSERYELLIRKSAHEPSRKQIRSDRSTRTNK
jgi:hypothetical protein